jgi:hypothetical protein
MADRIGPLSQIPASHLLRGRFGASPIEYKIRVYMLAFASHFFRDESPLFCGIHHGAEEKWMAR